MKELNDTARLDGIVLTLLIFSIYSCINKDSPLLDKLYIRVAVVKKIIAKLRKIYADIDINRALNT
jgi:hypothetical protein